MAIFGSKKKEEELMNEIEVLKGLAHPDFATIEQLKAEIARLNDVKANLESGNAKLSAAISESNRTLKDIEAEIKAKKSLVGDLDSQAEITICGIYTPKYEFANSDLYKSKLTEIRNAQKEMIKNKTACKCTETWTVGGSEAKGRKMVGDMQKLLLRTFNVECDDIVANVKVSNLEKSIERVESINEQISKLGSIMYISIVPAYVELKKQEVYLALDFQQKKQEEKDRLKELKAQQKEEARIQKEIEESREKLRKEKKHYENELNRLMNMTREGEEPSAEVAEKIEEIKFQMTETDKAMSDVDYREANRRAGYVYVISNIGSFGENVYKIGMTRRLEPLERIDELGDASVPFDFDVHALIFSEDAPSLETALHNAFEDRKVNKINGRREFFNVSLDEIKSVVRQNFDKTVEWIDIPEASQYRQSISC